MDEQRVFPQSTYYRTHGFAVCVVVVSAVKYGWMMTSALASGWEDGRGCTALPNSDEAAQAEPMERGVG